MAERQTSFADLEAAGQRRRGRRERFLEAMDEIVPWAEWVALIEPHCPDGRRGRRPVGCERMLRMHLIQAWFHLSDGGCEDAVPGSRAMRRFAGVGLMSEQVPGAATLLGFRRLPEEHGLGGRTLSELASALEARGAMMQGGSIADAAFVGSPSSTKNRGRSRDPEARQARKGGNWHFGYKARVGADAGTGLVHTASVTAANAADVAEAHRPLRRGDRLCCAGAGCAGVAGRAGVAGGPALSGVEWHVARRRSGVAGRGRPEVSWERGIERALARVRSKVEHPSRVVKDVFGLGETRCRGPEKNRNQICVAFALADLCLLSWAGRGIPAA